MELDKRKETILSSVIEFYVAYGEPISSKSLVEKTELNVSSATIRNELMYLVENGYLCQPHTSSGRIPTKKGYRYYVDHLLKKEELPLRTKEYISNRLSRGSNTPESILKKASQLLAEITEMAAVTSTPPMNDARVHRIKFVATSRHSVMLVLISTNGVVKSKIFRSDFVVTPEMLAMYDKVINEKFTGVELNRIDKVFIQTIASTMGEMSLYMPEVLFTVYETVLQAKQANITVSGETNLLFLDGYDFSSARNVLRFLEDEKELSNLMNECNDVKVFLGDDSKREELKECALIVKRYEILGEKAGAIAIIGPNRINYSLALSYIEYISQCVSELISEILDLQRR